MAVPECRVKEQWIGNNVYSDFTFDFTIQDLQHLLVIVQNNAGDVVEQLRGDDISFLSGVVFDSKLGGGTISLRAVLPNGWVLTALQANDAPTQPSEFKDKFSFTLELFELALDYITTALQRAAYLGQRSVKLHDVDDSYDFDPTLPKDIAANPRATIVINSFGNGLAYGPTTDEILAAQDFKDEAVAAATAALAAENNAEISAAGAAASALSASVSAASAVSSAGAAAASAAIAVAASGYQTTGPFLVNESTNSDLAGELTDHTVSTMVEYKARVIRGMTVFALINFMKVYRNGAWELVFEDEFSAAAAAASGTTFTLSNTATGQVNAAVATDGAGNAAITFKKMSWAA